MLFKGSVKNLTGEEYTSPILSFLIDQVDISYIGSESLYTYESLSKEIFNNSGDKEILESKLISYLFRFILENKQPIVKVEYDSDQLLIEISKITNNNIPEFLVLNSKSDFERFVFLCTFFTASILKKIIKKTGKDDKLVEIYSDETNGLLDNFMSESFIKDLLSKIEYKIGDNDKSEEKQTHIKLTFYRVLSRLKEYSEFRMNKDSVVTMFKETFTDTEQRYAVLKNFNEVMLIIPYGILEVEKLTHQSSDKINQLILDKTKILEESNRANEEKFKIVDSKLNDENTKISLVLDHITEYVLILGSDKNINYVSKSFLELISLQENEVIGKHIDDILYLYLSTYSENNRVISDQYCLLGTNSYLHEYESNSFILISNDKKSDKIGITFKSISTIEDGVLSGFILIMKTKNGDKEKEEIEFIVKSLDLIKTPLMTVQGYIGLLSDNYLSKKENRLAKGALYSAELLMILLDNLNLILKVENGNLELFIQKTEWISYLEKIVQEYKEILDMRTLKFEFKYPVDRIVNVRVDPVYIQYVIKNLLMNAVNTVGQKGHINLTVEILDNRVRTHILYPSGKLSQGDLNRIISEFDGNNRKDITSFHTFIFISNSILLSHGSELNSSEEGIDSDLYFNFPLV